MVSPETGIKYYKIGDSWFSPTHERLLYLKNLGAAYSIITDVNIQLVGTRNIAICRAVMKSGEETFSGHAQQSFHDQEWGQYAIQVAETKAVGRALGNAGIGIEYGFATLDEVADDPKKAINVSERAEDIVNTLNNTLKKKENESK